MCYQFDNEVESFLSEDDKLRVRYLGDNLISQKNALTGVKTAMATFYPGDDSGPFRDSYIRSILKPHIDPQVDNEFANAFTPYMTAIYHVYGQPSKNSFYTNNAIHPQRKLSCAKAYPPSIIKLHDIGNQKS